MGNAELFIIAFYILGALATGYHLVGRLLRVEAPLIMYLVAAILSAFWFIMAADILSGEV